MAIKHIAQYFGPGWYRVKGIDMGMLRRRLGKVYLSGVEVIALDEFTIQKGHRYATVIVYCAQEASVVDRAAVAFTRRYSAIFRAVGPCGL
jgi:hypothetical protein